MVLQHCITSESDGKRCFIYNEDLGSVSQCEYEEADILGEFLEKRISFRLQANIPICIDVDQNGMLYEDMAAVFFIFWSSMVFYKQFFWPVAVMNSFWYKLIFHL